MSVDFKEPTSTDGMPQLSAARRLFSGNYVNIPGFSYNVASNGDFILLESMQEPTPTRIRIVTNWLQQLRDISPAE